MCVCVCVWAPVCVHLCPRSCSCTRTYKELHGWTSVLVLQVSNCLICSSATSACVVSCLVFLPNDAVVLYCVFCPLQRVKKMTEQAFMRMLGSKVPPMVPNTTMAEIEETFGQDPRFLVSDIHTETNARARAREETHTYLGLD